MTALLQSCVIAPLSIALRACRSRRAAAVAATAMINHDLSVYKTSQAPPPETLYWSNIRWRAWERSLRSNLIWVAFWALAIFYVRSTALRTTPPECGSQVLSTLMSLKTVSFVMFVSQTLPFIHSVRLCKAGNNLPVGWGQRGDQQVAPACDAAQSSNDVLLACGNVHRRQTCVCTQLIPVGAVQALVNVNLLNKIPPFHQLLDIQFTNAIIVSILPGACSSVPLFLLLAFAACSQQTRIFLPLLFAYRLVCTVLFSQRLLSACPEVA